MGWTLKVNYCLKILDMIFVTAKVLEKQTKKLGKYDFGNSINRKYEKQME